jgi:cystathionine beta-synthase
MRAEILNFFVMKVNTPQVDLSEEIVMPKYDGIGKCTWRAGDSLSTPGCPHMSIPGKKRPSGPAGSALEFIGDTPLIRLERLMRLYNLPCELYAKCEFFNAGGSVKDRIGLRMIEEAERSGRLLPGDTIIEPTSGNTGIGLCVAAAIKGYRVIITMPEKMSSEKVNMMKCLGAEIIRTPDEAAWNSPESHIGVAVKLNKQIPRSHILDQYKNPANPLAHYEGTGAEILSQLNNDVYAVVVAAGTGGTLTGIGRKVKDTVPSCILVAVDPVGSILALPDYLNDHKRLQGYQVEGIGYDFIPTVLDRDIVDEWVKIDDPEALACARALIRYEALACGGSSGSNLAGALKWIRSQPREKLVGKKIVTILPDSSRNYMSKFLDDNWMIDKGFMGYESVVQTKQPWAETQVGNVACPVLVTIEPTETLGEGAKKILKTEGVDIPVMRQSEIVGSINETIVMNAIAIGKCMNATTVRDIMNKKPKVVPADTPMGHVAKMLEMHTCVFVYSGDPVRGVTRKDLLNFMVSSKHTEST